MGDKTGISWTDSTFNPWAGCTKISPACDNCYAEGWAKRAGTPELWKGQLRRTSPDNWKQPLRWNRKAEKDGVRRRVFCASLADVFDNQAPDAWRSDLFALIEETPNLDWLLLTKRPENVREMIWPKWDSALPANIWLGTTVEDRKRLKRIDHLRLIPARVRFLSIEPLLEDLGKIDLSGIQWTIVGGESGPGARPMHPRWARNLRDQCKAAGTAFFFKQRGEWSWPEDPMSPLFKDEHETTPSDIAKDWRERDRGVICMRSDGTRVDGYGGGDEEFLFRVGKARAGDLLDGIEHKEFPA